MSATIVGVGRLGQEPKMSYTPKGTAVTKFTLAVRSGYGDKELTTWLSAVVFGQLAEIANERLAKGARIKFSAEFVGLRTFTKQDETEGQSLDIKLYEFEFLDKASGSVQSEPEEF